MDMNNIINHPAHYNTGEIEVFDYIKDKLSPEELRGYIKGNILKYISREAHKNGDEDLRKANWYLTQYVELLGENKQEDRSVADFAEVLQRKRDNEQ